MDRRFRLQPLLAYRESREEALQLELAKTRREEQLAQERLEALRLETVRSIDELRVLQSEHRPDLAAINQGLVYLDAIGVASADQLQVVAEVVSRVEEKRREVVVAMQDRKVLEKLKQRHQSAYDQWVRQREERRLDDMVTVRYSRRQAIGEESVG